MEKFQVLRTSDFDPSIRGYRRRKVYSKTRTGCLICKAKKVKCDEAKPTCTRCQRNAWRCAYSGNSSHGSQQAHEPSTPPTDISEASSISYLGSLTVVPFSAPSAEHGTSSTHLIQHCFQHWDDIFHFVYNDTMLSAFQSNLLARNVMLAIAACHLRHMSPDVLQYRIAEHFQQSLAFDDYRKALATPVEELGQHGTNLLLLSGTLFGILAFPLPAGSRANSGTGTDESDSWVFNPRDDRMGWLAFQSGIRPLLRSANTYLAEAMDLLGPVFLGSKDTSWTTMAAGSGRIPPKWAKFFGLDKPNTLSDTEDTNKTQEPQFVDRDGHNGHRGSNRRKILDVLVRVASYLKDVEPSPSNIFRHITFLAKAHLGFQTLLYERDERALWLYGYWFGLMCRFNDLWWSQHRARMEYQAIRLWLRKLRLADQPGSEGVLWAEMMIEYDAAPFFAPGGILS